jgi:hypothetical protein
VIDVAVTIWTVLFPTSLVLLLAAPLVSAARFAWEEREKLKDLFDELMVIELEKEKET